MEKRYSLNIKQLREEAGMSEEQLAKELGVFSVTVFNWESGEKEPTEAEYEKLAMVFKSRAEYIKNNSMELDGGKLHSSAKFKENLRSTQTLLIGMIWLLAVVLFGALRYGYGITEAWLCYVFAVPATFLFLAFRLVAVHTKLSNPKIISYLSVFIWTLALSLFLAFRTSPNMWIIFLAALPLQLIVVSAIKLKK